MKDLEKIATIESEVQAQLLAAVLEERGIPYLLRSYRDSSYDGIFQSRSVWGHLEAPNEHREEILAVIADLKNAEARRPIPEEEDGGD
jgi:hypothetical protein